MTVAVPQHVAIIMDGNGRWAAAKGMHRFYGHRAGADAAKTAIRCALDASIPYLSLYAFSQENRARPAKEVKELIKLYHDLLKPETVHKLCEHRVALRFVGDVAGLDTNLAEAALQAEQQTAEASPRLTVVVALNYSGRWDVLQATQALLGAQRTEALAESLPLTEADFARYLSLHGVPDPDLLIRTGGETRLSNFLLWQLAYTELFFTDVHWPNFSEAVFAEALGYYASRERRFGALISHAE